MHNFLFSRKRLSKTRNAGLLSRIVNGKIIFSSNIVFHFEYPGSPALLFVLRRPFSRYAGFAYLSLSPINKKHPLPPDIAIQKQGVYRFPSGPAGHVALFFVLDKTNPIF